MSSPETRCHRAVQFRLHRRSFAAARLSDKETQMDKLKAAYNWLWAKAPAWRRYGLIALIVLALGFLLGGILF